MTKFPYRILMNLTYDGAAFYGWQRQSGDELTIQGVLEEKLSQIFNTPITVVGSGRTDRGAHALSQWAHSNLPKNPTNMNLCHKLNRLTPDALRINAVYLAPPDFHAQRSCIKKKYIYKIYNAEKPHPLKLHYFHHERRPLDFDLLNKMASHLVGKKDFKSFQSTGTEVETTVRTIFRAYWLKNGANLTFHVVGDGFLKQMVRNMVGTMLWCALHPKSEETFVNIIKAHDRRKAKNPAPAHGLFLKWVKYPSELDNKCRKL